MARVQHVDVCHSEKRRFDQAGYVVRAIYSLRQNYNSCRGNPEHRSHIEGIPSLYWEIQCHELIMISILRWRECAAFQVIGDIVEN